jgi:hypothetical protein
LARAIIRKRELLPQNPVATLLHKKRPFVFADTRNSQSLRTDTQPTGARRRNCLIPDFVRNDRVRAFRQRANATTGAIGGTG